MNLTSKKISINSFVIALIIAIFLAFSFPEIPSIIFLKEITSVGVACIFFFYGLKLSFKELALGIKNYKIHLLVQLATFLIFPIVILLFRPLIEILVGYDFWIGMFFLAAPPYR